MVFKNENHAYAALTKGSKDVTYSRCVFAHSITRSPSFSSKGKYDTDVAVRHCIIYGFTDEGTKFHDGAESGNKCYKLRIHDNYYSPLIGLNPDRLKEEIAPFPNVDSEKKQLLQLKGLKKIQIRSRLSTGEMLLGLEINLIAMISRQKK